MQWYDEPEAPKAQAQDPDLSDFEAGAATIPDDFKAADFAPPEPERPEYDDTRLPPPFHLNGVDLLSPPGFAGDITSWIDINCEYPRRRLAVISALVTIGNIGGLCHDDVRDPRTSANMLAFCVAASSTGKEAVMNAMMEMHRAAGLHYAVQGGIKSEQEITRNLIEHQPAYYIIDEIGIFLQKVRNAQKRGSAAYLEGVFGLIMSAYSKSNSQLVLNGDLKRELRKIYAAAAGKAEEAGEDNSQAMRMLRMVDEGLERPFLSIIGYTTPSTFDNAMDGESATQGFVGRSVIVTERDINPYAREDFKKVPLPMGMAMKLVQISSGGDFDASSRGGNRIEYGGPRIPVSTDPDADQMMKDVRKWMLDYADVMKENAGESAVALIRRGTELVAKISFILAIPGKRRTADHVRWAFAYVKQELDAKIALVFANDNVKHRPEEAAAARLMGYIDPDKGTSTAVLANRAKMPVEAVDAIMAKLLAIGSVRSEESKRKHKGKVVPKWFPMDK